MVIMCSSCLGARKQLGRNVREDHVLECGAQDGVLDILSLRYLLDIQVGVLSWRYIRECGI